VYPGLCSRKELDTFLAYGMKLGEQMEKIQFIKEFEKYG
jgi:hypothetical protein